MNWTAPSGRPTNDWIALYKVGNPNTTYGSWQYTQGATSGSFSVTAPTPAGLYEFRYLLQGGYTDVVRSNIVPITTAPTVSITSPTNNASFNAPVNITINATASDADGISKVEFFQGSNKLGESATSPYSFVWNSASSGSSALTAKATDTFGAVTTSSTINITVNPASGGITGKVTRLDGTTAIPGATVKAYQGSTPIGSATTNSTGDYTVASLANATYSVEASAPGYDTKTQTGVTVSGGATTTLNLSLSAPISYLYDQLGRLVCVIDKDGNAATYAYDAVGNLLSISRQSPSQVSVIGFTPNNGVAGNSVNIYGTGFSTTASQNSVSFNGTAASVVASSPTLIVTSVPSGATTGPISVTSPTGSASSAASFTVGAATGAPTITSFTPTVGVAATAVTISGTNFDTAIANDRVSFNTMQSVPSSATTTSIGAPVPTAATSGHISVSTPSGKAVSSADFFVPPSPYTAADVIFTGRMAIGENRTITLGAANKIGLMLFDGTVGQKICLNIIGVTIASCNVSIYKPDGSTLVSSTVVNTSGKFIDTLTLPNGGTYTLLISLQSSTGSMTLAFYNVVDITGTIIAGGSAVTTTVTSPGQNARYTFSGTSSQRVSLNMTGVTLSGSVVTIYKPDGAMLANYYNVTPPSAFIDTVSLPDTGTYSILVDPFDTRIGAMTLTLYSVTDFSGSTTVGGTAVSVPLNTPGQNGQVTFSGTSSQLVTVRVTSNTIPGVLVKLLKPDGSQLTSTYSTSSSFNLAQQTLPTTGTYTIVIDPNGVVTGSLNVSVTSP